MVQNSRGYLASLMVTAATLLSAASIPIASPARGTALELEGDAPGRRTDQEALKAFAPFVGDWRGTGQVERGRAKGAWTESASWAWKLTNDSAALEMTVKRGKHLKSGILRPGKTAGTFVFEATLADDSKRTFNGKTPASKDPLVLKADSDGEGIRRITLTPLHDTRLIVLMEAEEPGRRAYSRIGEVGYTREGVKFAAGESGPVCIVTEGRGTIKVTHKGQTYWVCCSGCKDLFNDDPEAVLAEAAARKKAKKDDE